MKEDTLSGGLSYPIEYHPMWEIVDSSKLKDYMACPRMYFYSHLLGWRPEEKSFHLIFGECWHRAMEFLLLNGYSPEAVREAHKNHFMPLFLEHFLGDEVVGSKSADNALVALAFYAGKYREDFRDFEVLHTEVDARVPISETRFLSLRMDDILRDMEGQYFSLEHKTGTTPHKLWNEQWTIDIQIGTYTHALYCFYPIEQIKGVTINAVFFTKKKSDPIELYRIPIYKSLSHLETWLRMVNSWYSRLKRDMFELAWKESDSLNAMRSFPMNPGRCTDWGRVCHFHDFCCTWSNPLQHCDKPPLGFTRDFWNPEDRPERPKINLEWRGR